MSRFKTNQIFVTVTKVQPTPVAPNPAYWEAKIQVSDSFQEYLKGNGIDYDCTEAPSGTSLLNKEEALQDLIAQLISEPVIETLY